MPYLQRKSRAFQADQDTAGFMSPEDKVKMDKFGSWADFSDAGTSVAPIELSSNTYSQLINDGLGSNTRVEYRNGFTFWDTSTNKMDVSDFSVGDQLFIRADFELKPNINESKASFRLWFEAFGGFQLHAELGSLDEGAGIWYQRVVTIPFYVGSEEVKNNPIQIQVKMGSAGQARVNGWYIGVL